MQASELKIEKEMFMIVGKCRYFAEVGTELF